LLDSLHLEMGQNASTLPDSVIDDSPILTTQDWSLHHAESTDHGPLSVFIAPKSSQDSNLSLLAKGLKLYRHPSILKYYAWAPNANQIYLFTEKACPISLVRSQQNPYSTGLGLFEICQAIKFLHETGEVIHGNIKENCVFVTPAGDWKLAALENVQKVADLKAANVTKESELRKDIFSLGLLITELLSRFTDSDSQQFLEYAKSNLLLPDFNRRPDICQVLDHAFFKQEYILILTYLKNLTLKSDKEKEEFFGGLGDTLMSIPQQVLGQHFAKPLLSRYVMMDLTARTALIPRILQPRTVNPDAVFEEEYFVDFVVPQIKTLFLVHDYSIRLILLDNFCKFCTSIDNGSLEEDFLPSIIVGLKDTNPVIVSQTLRCLADIVPILGPEKVIGKNVSRVFSDGSPSRKVNKETINITWNSGNKSGGQTDVLRRQLGEEARDGSYHLRVPPIGAEMEEEAGWESWGEEESSMQASGADADRSVIEDIIADLKNDNENLLLAAASASRPTDDVMLVSPSTLQYSVKYKDEKVCDDISKLDVKTASLPAANQKPEDDVDFFADMTPDIPKNRDDLQILEQAIDKERKISLSQIGKFAASTTALDASEGEGWGDDDW